jgi:hypothetical protein
MLPLTSLASIQGFKMSVAFSVSAPDCDVHYFKGAPATLFCIACDSYISKTDFVPQLDMRRATSDFCFTYDGRLLVSQHAKAYLNEHCVTPLNFSVVDSLVGFHVLRVELILQFNSDRRKTRFERKCATCGNYESIVGATPVFIRNAIDVDKRGIYRTDLSFGSGREKAPVLVVGGELKRELEKMFHELEFREVNQTPLT